MSRRAPTGPESAPLAPALPGLPPGTLARLEAYVALLAKWTPTINLVAAADRAHLWSRHVLDSLRLLPLIPPGTARGIDLGSGAGLPGLVLAIAAGIPFDLVESDRRKAAFLMEAQRATGAPVQVHCVRIEAAALPPAPLVTARALAPLGTLLGLATPLLAADGLALFPKGARAAEELAQARQDWTMDVRQVDDPAHPGSCILAIRNPRQAIVSKAAHAEASHAKADHAKAKHA